MKHQAWKCKIGVVAGVDIPLGGDYPMRVAIQKAFKEVTGQECEATFSGWGQTFTPMELHVIDPTKYPNPLK